MARTFWKERSPIGDRMRPASTSELPWYTIVGVVKDVKQGGVDQKTGTELYFNAPAGGANLEFWHRGR